MGKGCLLNIYEEGTLEKITGTTLRPGGFELTKKALSFCQFPAGSKVLDIGCGTGETVRFLIEEWGLEALGIDASPVMIQKGRERHPDLPIKQGSGEALPYPGNSMDGVLLECSFGLIDDKEALLAEIFRVLKERGKLIISDIYYRNRVGMYSKNSILAMIEGYGFVVELWEDHSDYLIQLTVESIMKYGTADTLWACLLGKKENQGASCKQIKGWKPGYYLLIAQKPTD